MTAGLYDGLLLKLGEKSVNVRFQAFYNVCDLNVGSNGSLCLLVRLFHQ